MGEHGGRYKEIAEYMGRQGGECWIMDLRGFGRSGGKRACVKHFSDFEHDLEALVRHAFKTEGEVSSFLLGHSFGGLLTASYLSRSGANAPAMRGLILSSPIFGIGLPVAYWRHCLGILSSYLLPDYVQTSPVDPAKLTHDQEILKKYPKDPLIFHCISSRLYRELVARMKERREIAQNLHLPTLVLQAGEDFIVSREKTLRFYSELAAQDKELEVYEGFYHELFNETNRKTVFERMSLWFSKRI